MKLQVPYRADAGRRLSPRPEVPGEWQVVDQDLGAGRSLHVELARSADGVVRVAVARLRVPLYVRTGRMVFQNIPLTPDQVELIEVTGDE